MGDNFQSWGADLSLSGYSEEEDNNYPDYTSNFPTNLVFEHREELIDHVKATARSLGFTLVIGSSNLRSLFTTPRLYIDCDRSDPYRPPKNSSNTSSKNTGTKKNMCPFRLKGHKHGKVWRIEVVNGVHNHQNINYEEGHANIGKLTKREWEIVETMSFNHCKNAEILAAIKKENPENKSTSKTISNARSKLRVSEYAGRTQVQQLLHLLQTKSYLWTLRSDNETDELQDIFFAHSRSLELFKSFPYILFMDCTYKTNRFRLPLLEIVGVTSTRDTFSVAFVFMQSEKIDNYVWALNCLQQTLEGCDMPRVILTDRDMSIMHAVSVVFPNSNALLCKWHISTNVKAHCKSTLGNAWKKFKKYWKLVVDSNTLEEYQMNTQSISNGFQRYPIALQYIGELLDNYKVKFVAFWTNQSMHYGNRTTNRAEAQHSKLKRYLRTSMGNLATVFQYIDEMIDSEFTKIKRNLERSRNFMQHAHRDPIFRQLRGYVSAIGLQHIADEINRCKEIIANGVEYCGCRLRVSHELPCAHELQVYICRGIPIPLDRIDPFWTKLDISNSNSADEGLNCVHDVEKFVSAFQNSNKFNHAHMLRKMREAYDPSTTPIVEPQPKNQGRGRPSTNKKHETSTRRDPSAFEYVDGRALPGRHSSYTPAAPKAPRKKRNSFHERNKTKIEVAAPNSIGYFDEFPQLMHKFINGVTEVAGDGHCGFRAISTALNLLHGENSWPQVRTELLNELVEYGNEYMEMFGRENAFAMVYNGLLFDHTNNYCLQENWFTVSDMGHLVASKYNIAFVVLSRDAQTFLPWRTGPPQHPHIKCIGHVNDNHFVQLSLCHNPPMPPINPQWITWRYEQAGFWENLIQEQLQRYINLRFLTHNEN